MASRKAGADFDPDEELNKDLIQCPYVPTHMIRQGTRFQRHLPKCRTEQLKQTTSPFHERALDMKVCKFDQSHHLPSREMPEHEKNCDAREIVERLTVLTTEEPAWKKRIPKINAGSTEVKVKAAQPPTGLQAPPPGADPLYKTRLCKNFTNGQCKYGTICQFAHGPADLRSPPARNPVVRDWDEVEEDWGENADIPAYNPMKKIEEAKGSILHNPMNCQRSERIEFRRNQRLQRNAPSDEDWGTPSPPNKATAAVAERGFGRGQGKSPAPPPPGLFPPGGGH